MPKPIITGLAGINPNSTTADGRALAELRRRDDFIQIDIPIGSTLSPIALGDSGSFDEPSLWVIQHSSGQAMIASHVGGTTPIDPLVADANFVATGSFTATQVAFHNVSGVLTLSVGATIDDTAGFWKVRRLL